MKRQAALLAVLFFCVFLCGCARWWELLPESSTTAPATTTAAPASAVTITVEGGNTEVGDTVILPVTVSGNAHLVSADVFLHYDPTLLAPVLQYDAATDSERYAEPGIFDGVVRSEKLNDGTVYVLLATGGDGTAEKGTLFYAAFRLLAFPGGDGATVTAEVPVCTVSENGKDTDAAAAGRLILKNGTVTERNVSATATATETTPETEEANDVE